MKSYYISSIRLACKVKEFCRQNGIVCKWYGTDGLNGDTVLVWIPNVPNIVAMVEGRFPSLAGLR